MEQEESKRQHGGKLKKSLTLKILDREKLLEQAQEKIMGMSLSELRRFLAVRKKKLEQVTESQQSVEMAEISPLSAGDGDIPEIRSDEKTESTMSYAFAKVLRSNNV